MLTEEQLAATIRALKDVERLILVGDPRQLPPIGSGRLFVDMVTRLRPENIEVRESGPGGCGHACELETSMYLHLDSEGVRKDWIKDAKPKFSPDGDSVADQWQWVDLTLGSGPATIVDWSSAYGDTGAFGAPELATEEKGRMVFDHAVDQLVGMARWLKDRPQDIRQDFRTHPSTTELEFGF